MPLAPRFGITSPVWGQSISDSARRNLFVSVRLRHGLFAPAILPPYADLT